ncbi:MAG: P-II family nitrogen regulator [Clostridia bacterium]|nr:P-II family nitrogen regulator [Clostridia bacterium]
MDYKYEVIFCIVNEGFSGAVMDAARAAGATGGTITRSRGTANAEVEKTFGITVSSQKELVMILVDAAKRNRILHALYSAVGLGTPGQGIAFAMPVDEAVGVFREKESGGDAQKEDGGSGED